LKLDETLHQGALDTPRIQRMTQKKQLLLMEFIRGKSLGYIGYDDASLYFPTEISPCTPGSGRHQALKKIGALVVMDILINNWDRFPVQGLWEARTGNPKNVILHRVKDASQDPEIRVVGIDQMVSAITNPAGKQKYIASLQKVTEEVLQRKAKGRTPVSIKS